MILNRILILLALCWVAFGAEADVLHLKNGDRITGLVTAMDGESITIKPVYSEELVVNFTEVAQVETEAVTEVELADGTVGMFRLAGSDEEGQTLLLDGGEELDVAITEIQRYGPPPEKRRWGINLVLSSSFNRGNTNSDNLNLQGRTSFTRGMHRYKGDLVISREEEDGTTTKEKDRLKAGYNWLFQEKWFFALDSTFERDPIAELDHRVSLNPALGYDIWNDNGRVLNVQLGAGYGAERRNEQDESSANIDWRLEFSKEIFEGSLILFHNHNIYRNISGRENIVLNSQTGIRYDFTDDFYLNVQANYDYDTEPAAGNDSKDLEFLIGAGLDF